jgi:hypothetical protein
VPDSGSIVTGFFLRAGARKFIQCMHPQGIVTAVTHGPLAEQVRLTSRKKQLRQIAKVQILYLPSM